MARADNSTDGALPSDGSAFGHAAVFEHYDQRRHRSRQRKVGNDDILFRFEENLTLRQVNKLNVGLEHGAIDCRNCGEEAISPTNVASTLSSAIRSPETVVSLGVADCHRRTEMSVACAT